MAAFAEHRESLTRRKWGLPGLERTDDNQNHCFAECGVLLGESTYHIHMPSRTSTGMRQLMFVYTSNILNLAHAHPLNGFYVVSLPLNQLDMLGRAAAGKENYMHITVCCQGTILCWPSRSIWPLPQPPEKKKVCAQSLFYGTQARSKHTVWHLFPIGRTVTNTSCVHTTEHLQVCVIYSTNYSRKPSAGSSTSY